MYKNYGKDVSKLSNQIKRLIHIQITKTGLPGAQGRALHYLAAHQDEDIFQKDVEEEFNLRPSSASGLLKALENEGYIKREAIKEDGRYKKIVLLDRAKDIADSTHHDLSAIENQLIKDIDQKDLDTFKKVLDKMYENLSEEQ